MKRTRTTGMPEKLLDASPANCVTDYISSDAHNLWAAHLGFAVFMQFEDRVSPHPGPLPWGEGERRIQLYRYGRRAIELRRRGQIASCAVTLPTHPRHLNLTVGE